MNRIFFFLVLIFISNANAAPLVADMSNYQIAMDSSFNGTRIFLFGTRNESGDIVIVIRGENKKFIVRKKEEFAGIWINKDRMKLYNIPNFYAVASSKPLAEIDQNNLFKKLSIGEENLLIPPEDLKKMAQFNEFEEAFLNYKREEKLYHTNPDNISFVGETLFKTVIEFNDNIPPGNYTAEIYLISDGEIVGMQTTPISVVKTGLEAFVYNYAHQSPILYGLSAIILALCAGWFAGRIFEIRA